MYASLAPLRALALPVRWLPADSLHLTLAFLGELDVQEVAMVEEIVGQVAAKTMAFDIEIGGLGAFPTLERPRVWWVGVRAPRLDEAHSALDAAIAGAGLRREERPFSPHITVGRTKDRPRGLAGDVAGVLRAMNYHARIRIETIDLMESQLSRVGARYHTRLAAELARAASVTGAGTGTRGGNAGECG